MGHIQHWHNMVALTTETLWATMEWGLQLRFAEPHFLLITCSPMRRLCDVLLEATMG
jgi:hypothetical protein